MYNTYLNIMNKRLLDFYLIFLGLFPFFLMTSCGTSKKIVAENREIEINVNNNENDNIAEIKKIVKVDEKTATKNPKGKLDRIMVYLGDESVEKWQLVKFNSQNASEFYENLPMMRFDEPWKQIYGTTGCNKFTAYYTKENSFFDLTRLSSTELPCNQDEKQFLNALQNADEIREGDSILSFHTGGQETLVFEKY